jgi:hypothetical protein
MKNFRWQLAGNIQDDAESIELIDDGGDMVADVTRYVGRKELKINTFGNDVDLAILEEFIRFARMKLDPFEDGSSLTTACVTQIFSEN